MSELDIRSATAIAAAVTNGTHTAHSVVAGACQSAAADTNNAIIRVLEQRAHNQAAAVDQRIANGDNLPLAGVPIIIKDNLCLEGVATTACSRILDGFVAPYTADAVARLETAGAVVIASANMDEFAMGSSNETSVNGPVTNPHDPTTSPGGSSGGSAASVAAGIAPLALGSDTGGSIRQPAAFCGVYGFKPTYGHISRRGLIAFGSSLDQIGPFANSIDDLLLCSSVMSGHDELDSTSCTDAHISATPNAVHIAGLRVGVVPAHREGCSAAVSAALDQQLESLQAAGADIVPIELPHEQYAVATYYIIATAEAASNLSRYDGVHYGRRAGDPADLDQLYRRSRGEGFGDEVKRRIILGTYVLSDGYQDAFYRHAMKVRACIAADFSKAFETCDVILGPTSPTPAFKLGEKMSDPLAMYLSDVYTIAANLAGIPALSVPTGATDDGLPIGLHLQSAAGSDARLLATAKAITGI